MENLDLNRNIKDYVSDLEPKLILINETPKSGDKNEILDSVQGLEYLSTVFQSRFKAIDTHVTYLYSDLNQKSDSLLENDRFVKLFQYYWNRDKFDSTNIVFAFVGNKVFEDFKHEIDSLVFNGKMTLFIEKTKNAINTYVIQVNKSKSMLIPYVILPDSINSDEDKNFIINTLNNTAIAKHIKVSPYSSTKEVTLYLRQLLYNYENKKIKGFRYDAKINHMLKKTEWLKLYDYYTQREVLYCKTDEACQNDTKEDLLEFRDVMLKVLKTIPVCGNDIENSLLYYKNKDEFKIVEEDEIIMDINDEMSYRNPYFKLIGDKNGEISEWYEKWHNKVLPNLKFSDDPKEHAKMIKQEGYDDERNRYKYEWIYDIEVFKEDWLFVAMTLDKKNKVICWNDPINLHQWIRNKILIGFNNAQYDDSVIRHALLYPYAKKGTLTVKEYSDALIYNTPGIKMKKYPELRKPFENLLFTLCPQFLSWDISFHMPFDIRRNSLKKLTMSTLNKRNYDSSVSFDIDRPLTEEERRDVEKYCEMDVENTLDLYLPDPEDVKKKEEDPKYKMREYARDSYDIKWNLIVEYNMTAKTLINKSASFAGKVLCGENAKPEPRNTTRHIDGRDVFYSIPELAYKELAGHPVLDFYIKNQENAGYIKEKFEYYMGGNDEGHKYQFGFGGLHQALINYSGKNLCNFDVASLYPSLLIQYNLASRGMKNPQAYKEVYDTRIKAKHEGNTLLNLGLKLVLNGSIGAFLSNYNPLYDTWSNSTVCVYGQLLLFILCKRLYDAGFVIVQTNTDGIMVERRDDIDFMVICKQWENETRLNLEYDDIAIVRQLNVNNYTTVWTNGKVKSKGVFLNNEKFSNAVSKILCNISMDKPLLEGCQPRDFVIYKRHAIGEIYDAVTNKKLEGRSLAFVIGKESDPRTQAYYSRSRNEREVVVKDEKGKPVLDENGNQVKEIVHSISKISGFTEHMLLVDDVNEIVMDDINTNMYIAMARNLLGEINTFGPYYTEGFVKSEEPAYLQALNPLKDAADEHPTKSGVICQNFLFECDYLTKEEQEELIKPIEKYTYRIVWSGNRSYHIVVRINKPCTSVAYKKIWYYLQYKLGIVNADEQANLPSKYTRVPDFINPKTGNMQELYSENKYEFDLDEILENVPRLKEAIKKKTEYKGKITMDALEKHIKKQDWSDGNRFSACQKLSPVLISQVSLEQLIGMIPCKLEKDHLYVLRAKYYYFEKYKNELISEESTPLDDSEEI